MTATSLSLLRRFVIAGLRDTLDCYIAGTLPLHRFAWELDSRVTALAELTGVPDWRALAALRTIAAVDAALRAVGRVELSAAESHAVGVAVVTLRAALARLDPPQPPHASASGAVGAAGALPAPVEPTHPRSVVVPLPSRPPRVRAGAATGQRASRQSRQRLHGPEWEVVRAEEPR